MISKLSNERKLIIADENSFNKELGDEEVPCVIMLTAWKMKGLFFNSELVKYLLARGATYFVCVGDNSEWLHDQIDLLIYQCDEASDLNENLEVVTTYHSKDTSEEAVDFFVHCTELRNKQHGCMLALLDDDNLRDMELFELLKIG